MDVALAQLHDQDNGLAGPSEELRELVVVVGETDGLGNPGYRLDTAPYSLVQQQKYWAHPLHRYYNYLLATCDDLQE